VKGGGFGQKWGGGGVDRRREDGVGVLADWRVVGGGGRIVHGEERRRKWGGEIWGGIGGGVGGGVGWGG